MSCSHHRETKNSLNASQIAYKIHKHFLTMFFHTPTSLPSQWKLNILIGATGYSAHTHTTTQNSTTATVIQQYSHHKLYTVTTLCSRRSIFSSFCRLFVRLCKFSTKPQKFICSCLSLEFAASIALNLRDQAPLQRQPYTALTHYWYMPELIKLWKKKNPTEAAK